MVSGIKRFINPVTILIVTALVVLLLNRELFYSEQSESKEVKQLLDRVDGVVERMNQKAEAGQVDLQPQPDGEAEEAVPSAEITAQSVKSDPEKERPVDERTTLQDSAADGAVSQGSQVHAGEASVNAVVDLPGAPFPENSTTDISDNVVDEGTTPTGVEPSTIWIQARDAAWKGEPKKAVRYYRKLIAMQPENYDAYGELGNVLLQMGQTEAAVEAYIQCSLLLSQFGHRQSAWYMLEIVSRLDRDKAQELYQQLYSQPSPSVRR